MKRKTAQGFTFLQSKKANPVLKSKSTGFTLIELLVVIAIIAILAVVLILVLNPAETNARARDSKRLSDLQTLQSAINIVGQEIAGLAYCKGTAAGSACPTTSNKSTTGGTANDGTGWVKIDLTQVAAGSGPIVQVASLPTDPANTATYHYTYCTDNAVSNPTWEIATKLEAGSNVSKMQNDGGGDDTLYEIGTKLSLISGGVCAY